MQASLQFLPLPGPLDKKTLLAFRKDAGWEEKSDEALGGALGPQARVQWVTVKSKGKTVAIARLELAPPQFCHVSDLIVLGVQRGRGVGEWFMGQIERHCLGLGIPRVLLQPQGNSTGFYRKLHFLPDPLAVGFLKKEISPLRRGGLPSPFRMS